MKNYIKKLLNVKGEILELGRSCVHKDYRNKPIIKLLWKAISAYIFHYNIKFLFGCASFPGINPKKYKKEFSYLYNNYLAPSEIRPIALKKHHIKMNHHKKNEINEELVFNNLPPLIKGYLRLGVKIGEGAVIDEQFNTIDICIVLNASMMKKKYLKHYKKIGEVKNSKIIFFNNFFKKINK